MNRKGWGTMNVEEAKQGLLERIEVIIDSLTADLNYVKDVSQNSKRLEQENEYMRQLIRKMDRQIRVYDTALRNILVHNSASAKAVANEALLKVRGNKV